MKIGKLLDVEPHDSMHFKTEPYMDYVVECKIAYELRDMANKIQYILFVDVQYRLEFDYENR